MKRDKLEMYREMLLAEKAKLLKRFCKEEDNNYLKDPDDIASGINDFELRAALSGKERSLLGDVESALDRIEKGSYGRCGICGDFIGEERLKVLPFARLCISCQSDIEGK